MGTHSDDVKKSQFRYYLQADSAADEWYAELPENKKKSWTDIEATFQKRWPRKTQAKKTEEEYEDEILGRKLKVDDLERKRRWQGEKYTVT